MILVIVSILLLGYVLIATANFTNVNKAAVAMFMGTVGWVLYISYGTDFVLSQHESDYMEFLAGLTSTSAEAKLYIAQNVFLQYVGRAAEVVLFLLGTMTIVDILDNNGCFDFISELVRTRNSRHLLWSMTAATFVLSANLDNVTTTVMMLVMMHKLISQRRHRLVYGCAIMLAANCGGALTVIGDPAGLVLWNMGAVTATDFSMSLLFPTVIAVVVPVWMLGRQLPERISLEWNTLPYRGDDTNLNRWQRLLMLFVGIGGLWFIPTFHNITKLSPFLGALCVLALLWVVNEAFNRKLLNADQMIQQRKPRVLQYGSIQLILYVVGIMLALGAVKETGALEQFARWCDQNIHQVYLLGFISGLVSVTLDSFTTAVTFAYMHDVSAATEGYDASFALNGDYWKLIAYCTAVGGSILSVGSLSGVALMKMENMRMGWFLRHFSWRVLVGWLLGMAVLALGLSF